MANVLVSEAALMNIADAIRLKNGLSTTYKPREMANAILAIETGTMITGNDIYIDGDMLVINDGGGGGSDIPLNTELINFGDILYGYAVSNSDGSEDASEWSCMSDYTKISPEMTFSFVGYRWYYIGFYDSSKNSISVLYMESNKDSLDGDYAHGTLTPSIIPSNAEYIRISSHPNSNITSSRMSLIRTA